MPFVEAYARSERGFWRCGKHWPASGARFEVTAEELVRIVAEPNLVVTALGESGEALDEARRKILETERAYRQAIEDAKRLALPPAEAKGEPKGRSK